MKKEPTEEGKTSDLPPGLTVKGSQAFPSGLPELNQNMLKGLHIMPGLGIPRYHSDSIPFNFIYIDLYSTKSQKSPQGTLHWLKSDWDGVQIETPQQPQQSIDHTVLTIHCLLAG